MEKESGALIGGGTPYSGVGIKKEAKNDAQLYLDSLKVLFEGTPLAGLALEVEELIKKNPHQRTSIERDVMESRRVAINSGYITEKNTPTWKATFSLPIIGNPFAQALPRYKDYTQRNLAEIIQGYKPREPKGAA